MTTLELKVTVIEDDTQGFAYTIQQGYLAPNHSEWFSDMQEMGEDLGVTICQGLFNKSVAEQPL